jgi:UDP-glucose 4-epimerase
LKQKHHVIVLDDLSNGLPLDKWPSFLKPQPEETFEFYHLDAVEFFESNLESATKGNYDLVINLAATVGGREVIEGSPISNARTIGIDASFFQWLVLEQPKHTIYMSSPVVYPEYLQDNGSTNGHKLSEKDMDFESSMRVGLPDMVYGWSKLTAEYLAYIANKRHGLNIMCPRPFSGYGEDQDMNYPMPSICLRALKKEDPLIVWGSGEQVRDFVHVDDIINCILETYPKLEGYNYLNIGWGELKTFIDIASLAADIVGYSPSITTNKDKPEGVKYRVADIKKMEQYYKPKVTLREGMTRIIKYLKYENKN